MSAVIGLAFYEDKDFSYISDIGGGNFGSVFKVILKNTGDARALKVSKAPLTNENVKTWMAEVRTLQ